MKVFKFGPLTATPRTLGQLKKASGKGGKTKPRHEVNARRYDERTNKAALELAGIWNKK